MHERFAAGKLSGVLARVLLVTGTVGVGKTTIAMNLAGLLAERGEPHAYLDLDALSGCWPRPDDDPFNTKLEAQNLGCVSANFAASGARSLILAGVVETQEALDLYEGAVGRTFVVVRLTAPAEVIEARLRRRYGDDDADSLEWHLDRAPILDAVLDASPVPMIVVSCTQTPDAVARAVITAAGWDTTPAPH